MPQNGQVIAVDVGGTGTKAALVDGVLGERDHAPHEPRIVRQLRRPTPTGGESAVLDHVTALAGELRAAATEPVAALGLVVPGTVDEERGIGLFSTNLGWRDVPFRDSLAERTGLPVAFGHDVRAGGLAEARLGAARDSGDAVVMPIGTGIAAALVLGGRLHTGGGFAGEIGHVDIGHGEPCHCGQRGCLEAVASSGALARRFAERTGRSAGGSGDVARFVRDGDPAATAVWDEAVDALSRGILLLSALLAPRVVVLGGGLALAGELLLGPLRAKLAEAVTFHRLPEVRPAELGDEAGCLGAALLAADPY